MPDIDRLTVTDGYREVITRVNGMKRPVDVCSALTKVQVVTKRRFGE